MNFRNWTGNTPNCFVTMASWHRLILQPNFANSSADPALMRKQPLLPHKTHSQLSQQQRAAVIISRRPTKAAKRKETYYELAKSIGKDSDRLEFDRFSAWLRHTWHSHPGERRACGRILDQRNPWHRRGFAISAVCILLLQTYAGQWGQERRIYSQRRSKKERAIFAKEGNYLVYLFITQSLHEHDVRPKTRDYSGDRRTSKKRRYAFRSGLGEPSAGEQQRHSKPGINFNLSPHGRTAMAGCVAPSRDQLYRSDNPRGRRFSWKNPATLRKGEAPCPGRSARSDGC